jgi:hypothetical protein
VSPASQMQGFLRDIRTAAWRTMGARYNAARRLRRREWFATFSIAMFSVVGVGLAVLQRVYASSAGAAFDNYLTTASILLGLFVLVISLIEAGSGNAVRAELLHRNAEDLNDLQRRIAQALAVVSDGGALDQAGIDNFRSEYEEIKRRCGHNHDPLDARRFDAEHRLSSEFRDADGKPRIGCLTSLAIKINNFLQPVRYFLTLWFVIVLILVLTPWPR